MYLDLSPEFTRKDVLHDKLPLIIRAEDQMLPFSSLRDYKPCVIYSPLTLIRALGRGLYYWSAGEIRGGVPAVHPLIIPSTKQVPIFVCKQFRDFLSKTYLLMGGR